MSHPISSASLGRLPMAGSKKVAANKRAQYQSPTVRTYTDDRLRRELDLGKAVQDLPPKNA